MNWLIWLMAAALVVSLIVDWRLRGSLAAARAEANSSRADGAASERQAIEAADRLARTETALAGIRLGVAAIDVEGTITPLNKSAVVLLAGSRHAGALVEAKIRALAETGRNDRAAATGTVDVHTPLPRTIEVTVDTTAAPDWAVVYIDDVTERTKVAAARTDFVANVSHELKTPLGALTLLSETLEGAENPEVRQRLIGRIGDQASRMARLVDDIMDLSLVDAGGLEPAAVDLAEVVLAAVSAVGDVVPASGVAIHVVPTDEKLVVLGDHRQLVSALNNLLSNAVTYTAMATPPRQVTVSTAGRGASAVIEVSDTGIGIPAKHLDRIFERFYRIDAARSRETGGTGLGLAIVRHVTRNHGGDIEVESESGVGSTFRIVIPREDI